MKRNFVLVFALVASVVACSVRSFSDVTNFEKMTLVRNVNIVDVQNGNIRKNMNVVVKGTIIEDIQSHDTVSPIRFDKVVDGTGKYLSPGLWDMHSHPWYKDLEFPLFIAHGVTGTRVTLSEPATMNSWRSQIAAGTLLGPRLSFSGSLVDGKDPFWTLSDTPANESEVHAVLTRQKQEGVDFVKVYSLLSPEIYLSIATQAKQMNLEFAGHVPLLVTPEVASNAGQRTFEHLYQVLLGCSSIEDELIAERVKLRVNEGGRAAAIKIWGFQDSRIAETFDVQKEKKLLETFRRNQTWQVPTFSVLGIYPLQDASRKTDVRLKYAPQSQALGWQKIRVATAAQAERFQKIHAVEKRVVADMAKANVPLLPGTDYGNPFTIAGASLHDELQLMVDAGVSTLRVLQSATLRAAEFVGKGDTLGSVEPGKFADLVLLNANPLENISNTSKISAVFVNGRLLERAELDAMLAAAEQTAKKY